MHNRENGSRRKAFRWAIIVRIVVIIPALVSYSMEERVSEHKILRGRGTTANDAPLASPLVPPESTGLFSIPCACTNQMRRPI